MFALLLLSLTAYAGEVAKDSVSTNRYLNEVEVLSHVRETGNMRQQPTAVSLLGREQLQSAHITSLKGIQAMVPSFYMPDYGSRLTSAIYIRGIGSRAGTPAVGLYVDDMPYPEKSAYDFHFYDIERLDVLRGPQGSLYGRNTMGGLIKVYTRNPMSGKGTDLRMGYATGDNHRNIALTHYHHPTSDFAFSAGGYYEGSDGFFRNITTGRKADGSDMGGGRLRAIWQSTPRLLLDASVNYDYSDEAAYPYFYEGHITAGRESRYRRSTLHTGVNAEYRADGWQMNLVTGYQYLRDRMAMDQDFVADDIYTLMQRQRSHTLTEEITFRSRDRHDDMRRWQWVGGVSFMYQWLSTDGPVHFMADGVQWLSDKVNTSMPDVSQIPALSMMGFSGMGVTFCPTQEPQDRTLLLGGTFRTPVLNTALFHQSTVRLTSQLKAIVGLRLDYEHLALTYHAPADVPYGFTMSNPSPMLRVQLDDLQSQLLYDGRLHRNELHVLPKVALQYDFSAHSNLYITVAQGMRSGGYNVQMFGELLQGALRTDMMRGIKQGVSDYLQTLTQKGMPPSVIDKVVGALEEKMPEGVIPEAEQVAYRPETSWNIEAGTHITMLERTLLVDASVFFIRTHNQQISRFVESGLGRMMVNAGRSRSLGGEVSARWHPTAAWMLRASYGYSHATFRHYVMDDATGQDLRGNAVPFTPRQTIYGAVARTWSLSPRRQRDLTFEVNYNGMGRIYWTEANDVSQPFYSLLGCRLALDAGPINVSLWGKNLTQKRYNTFYFESAGRGFEQHGKPFQLGLDLQVKF